MLPLIYACNLSLSILPSFLQSSTYFIYLTAPSAASGTCWICSAWAQVLGVSECDTSDTQHRLRTRSRLSNSNSDLMIALDEQACVVSVLVLDCFSSLVEFVVKGRPSRSFCADLARFANNAEAKARCCGLDRTRPDFHERYHRLFMFLVFFGCFFSRAFCPVPGVLRVFWYLYSSFTDVSFDSWLMYSTILCNYIIVLTSVLRDSFV